MQFPPTNKVLEESLFNVADAVALECATKYQWSSFHTWEYLEKFDCVEHVAAVADRVWDNIAPFGHCLSLATWVMQDLRAALQSKPSLAQYAQHAQLVVDKHNYPVGGQGEFHALTVIYLESHCIVIDLVAQPNAFRIDLGSTHISPENINYLSLRKGSMKFEYWICKGERKFNEFKESPRDGFTPGFVPMDPVDAVCEIAYPAVRPLEKFLYPPSRKHICVCAVFDYEIDGIPSARVGEQYIARSCHVRVDFWQLEIALGIPKAWLHRPENADVLSRSSEVDAFYCKKGDFQHIVAFCYVYLSTGEFDEQVQARLELMDDVASKLGLPRGEVHRVAEICARVHKERMAILRAKVTVLNQRKGTAIQDSEVDEEVRVRWDHYCSNGRGDKFSLSRLQSPEFQAVRPEKRGRGETEQ